jgi:predicted RNA-binding Zn ribbon-like protein
VLDNRRWDFDAGHMVLDFANTVEFHASSQPDEYLLTYADLIAWSLDAGLLSEVEAGQLLAAAQEQPQEAERMLQQAIALRETVYQLLSSAANGETLDETDLKDFNHYLSQTLSHSQIISSGEGFTWSWQEAENPVERVIWTLVRSAADLFTSQELKRVGECADDRGCGYLFIDTSRNHSRRWCSMEACGNRAKAQRHYLKKSKN